MLVFGWGNPSRGDDGLGAAFVGEAARRSDVEMLVDYQLQPEHALDLVGRDEVLFVDASTSGKEPFEVFELTPGPHVTVSTHHLSPGGLLAVYQRVTGKPPPRARLLAIRGWQFGLGEQLSERARQNLDAALGWWRSEAGAALAP
ncbi:MAG: hydrogenase maturation protease [Myxococcaceae bacterium]|nr:hydrogenase maturation protease [Myxococcaceae bacterium]